MSAPVDRLLAFLDASPTPYHAVATTAARLEGLGFTALDEAGEPEALSPGARRYIVRAGSIVAFRVGAAPVAEAGFRITAAHTDSPNLRLKPQPIVRTEGYVRLGVEVYGGVITATWADRDLGLAGRVFNRNGDGQLVDIRRPVCRVPNLAIHLNREVNKKGLLLNAQTQLPAVLTLDTETEDPLRTMLSAELGCQADDIATWDLMLYDLTPAALGGAHQEFVFSARLDNLACSHAALEGMAGAVEADLPPCTTVVALFDHEEIGSTTSRGARGRYLESVLHRIERDTTERAPGGLDRALVRSMLVSADMAHAVHPGFTDKHDRQHMPKINAGPCIKLNHNHRYTTEGDTSALFLRVCEHANVPVQWFVNRSDLACGSTVGPILASSLGMPALDVGNPMLSMHSAREMAGAADHPQLCAALRAFFEGYG